MDAHATENRAAWDDRVPVHVASPDYGVQRFVDDPEHLSDVVAFDAPLLGDVRGLRVAHLQCHIGTGFDVVHTSVGVLNWLPDLEPWAAAVAGVLRDGGRLYVRDGHPALWVWDEADGVVAPTYPHVTPREQPLTSDEQATYVSGDASNIVHTRQHGCIRCPRSVGDQRLRVRRHAITARRPRSAGASSLRGLRPRAGVSSRRSRPGGR